MHKSTAVLYITCSDL